MKTYFTNKLKKTVERIESTKKSIINGIDDYNAKQLVSLSESLKVLTEQHSELTNDAVEYCTVEEILAIADTKSWNGEPLNLFHKYSLEIGYKHKNKAITIAEREMLVKRFGYSLKDAKV